MNYRIVRKDELYHYGVKGMKWGVRKEYEPVGRKLGRRATPKSKVSAGKAAVYKSSGRKTFDKEKARKLAKIGLGVAVAGLTVAGGVYIYKSGGFSKLSAMGKSALAKNTSLKTLADTGGAFDKKMIESINAAHRNTPGGSLNCSHCSISYVLNTVLGKNTTAKPFVKGELGSALTDSSGVHANIFDLVFDGINKVDLTGNAKTAFDLKRIGDCKKSFKKNTQGILFVQNGFGFGHYVNYSTNSKGLTTIIDTQSNEILSLAEFSNKGWLARSIFDCSNVSLAEGSELYLKHMINGL